MRKRLDIAPKDRIILPLDVSSIAEARRLVELLGPHVGMFKIGFEFIYSSMADLIMTPDNEGAIELLLDLRRLAWSIGGRKTFLDGKLNDIPNTVGKASLAISRMGVNFFNVHASAGTGAIKAAVKAASMSHGMSKVLFVTVLTSIEGTKAQVPETKFLPDLGECVSIFGEEPNKKVLQFCVKGMDAGADGAICSPKELKFLRASSEFDKLILVTPGVRPTWADVNDQKRVMTPAEAVSAGADYIVAGRPITDAKDPVAAAIRIAEEIRLAA